MPAYPMTWHHTVLALNRKDHDRQGGRQGREANATEALGERRPSAS